MGKARTLDDIANDLRRQQQVRDEIVFILGRAGEGPVVQRKKVNGRFEFSRDKTVYVNHYCFHIDDEDFGPLFLKGCRYAL